MRGEGWWKFPLGMKGLTGNTVMFLSTAPFLTPSPFLRFTKLISSTPPFLRSCCLFQDLYCQLHLSKRQKMIQKEKTALLSVGLYQPSISQFFLKYQPSWYHEGASTHQELLEGYHLRLCQTAFAVRGATEIHIVEGEVPKRMV